ncbi:hypothetical protein WICMUC_000817 [Wickerhamomyces mucosus]|uniref:Uncharacterized protein n=1 Tax=Wickerhamomyces mucosus TaxID=1378264 RepID=A0A9P8PXZ5_9ASCO|nr:hypothetical protein WICMUC_000817 [Wickerhamomyces mucosus]
MSSTQTDHVLPCLVAARVSSESQISSQVSSEITLTNNSLVSETSESILVVGATGLIGTRIIKNLTRIIQPHQTLYVFSRSKFFPENRPNVINRIMESSLWAQEIGTIPNLTTVYSALGARSASRFINGQLFDLPLTDEFIKVNYNLNLQVAIAAKSAGVSNFILISNYLVNYTLPNLFHRKTRIRSLVESDIINLQFKNVLVFRPGPLVGIRDKIGSLKNFSFWSIIEGLGIISSTPFFFFNIFSPGSTFSFASTVGKASAVALDLLPEKSGTNVEVYDIYRIIQAAGIYNKQLAVKIIEEVKNISENDNVEFEDFEKINILLFGESLVKRLSLGPSSELDAH